ncbi:MAG: metal-dependent hydrolase [Candidatus Heimdallarchaeota archaeon]|nr:metal-dependent hydrolase [Candidatus Heimdallarchaeota archaeon]
MTLITTHIAIESLVVWFTMGKRNRTIFRERIGLFAFLSLFAALPDIDALLYIHRTYLHSIVWSTFIIIGVLSYLSYVKLIKKSIVKEKADLICRGIIIACVFLILHSVFDLNPGPVLLFYPFDDRLYSWNVSMIWDLDSFFYIKELKFDWSSISLNEGLDRSIFNMTPSERIDYFGSQYIELFIGEFPIHLLPALAWIIFFPGTALLVWLKKRPKPLSFINKIANFKKPILGLSLIFLSLGLIVGPGFRLNRTETRESTQWLSFKENDSIFGSYQKFELDKKDTLTLQGIFAGNNSNCEIVAIMTDKEHFLAIDKNLTESFDLYNNGTNPSYSWLVNSYRNTVISLIDSSLNYYLLSQNVSEGINFTLNQKMVIYNVVLILDWNATIDFIVQTQVVSTLQIRRVVEFTCGMILASIGMVFLTLTLTSTINTKGKERLKEKEEKDKPGVE